MKQVLRNNVSKALLMFLLFNDNTQAINMNQTQLSNHRGIFDRMENKMNEKSIAQDAMDK